MVKRVCSSIALIIEEESVSVDVIQRADEEETELKLANMY